MSEGVHGEKWPSPTIMRASSLCRSGRKCEAHAPELGQRCLGTGETSTQKLKADIVLISTSAICPAPVELAAHSQYLVRTSPPLRRPCEGLPGLALRTAVYQDAELAEAIAAAAMPKLSEPETQNAANVLWCSAGVKLAGTQVTESANAQDISSFAWAAGATALHGTPLQSALAAQAVTKMAVSGPQDASNMLRRLTTLECNEAGSFYFATLHLLRPLLLVFPV
eukprot:s4998_g5.t1